MKCNLVMLLMRILLSVYMFDVSSSNTQASAPRRVIVYVIRLRAGAPYWPGIAYGLHVTFFKMKASLFSATGVRYTSIIKMLFKGRFSYFLKEWKNF
jgi:hypothetical protein